jgi:hypothetical protein
VLRDFGFGVSFGVGFGCGVGFPLFSPSFLLMLIVMLITSSCSEDRMSDLFGLVGFGFVIVTFWFRFRF